MNGWKHKIAIAWAKEASLGPLPFWKRAYLVRHLGACAGCRSLALSLAELGYGYTGKGGLKSREASLLHRQLMAAFARQQKAEASQPAKLAQESEEPASISLLSPAPAQGLKDPMRPLFFISLGAAALAVACIVALSLPWKPSSGSLSASPTEVFDMYEPTPSADPSAVPPLEWSRINQ